MAAHRIGRIQSCVNTSSVARQHLVGSGDEACLLDGFDAEASILDTALITKLAGLNGIGPSWAGERFHCATHQP
jgi:hypothetical protein